jgi:hypothetical protein
LHVQGLQKGHFVLHINICLNIEAFSFKISVSLAQRWEFKKLVCRGLNLIPKYMQVYVQKSAKKM